MFGGHTGEYREIGTEAVGVAIGGHGLTFLLVVMVGVLPVGAGMRGVHQGLADRQLRRAVCHAGMDDKLKQFLPHVQIFRLAFGVRAGGGSRVNGGADCERQGPALSGTVGGGDFRSSLGIGNGHPKARYLLYRYCVRGAGGNGVLCSDGADDETDALTHIQRIAFVAAH